MYVSTTDWFTFTKGGNTERMFEGRKRQVRSSSRLTIKTLQYTRQTYNILSWYLGQPANAISLPLLSIHVHQFCPVSVSSKWTWLWLTTFQHQHANNVNIVSCLNFNISFGDILSGTSSNKALEVSAKNLGWTSNNTCLTFGFCFHKSRAV